MRPSKLIALAALGLPVLACGSLADSDKVAPIAKVQGALSASSNVPAGAHVALVWRRGDGSGVTVVQDTPLTNGRFSFELSTPPGDEFFFSGESTNSSGQEDTPVSTTPSTGTNGSVPTPVDAGTSVDPATPAANARSGLHTLTTVGGSIASPLSVAVAGFVLYLDANNNGRLDLQGDEASSPDTILGGNTDLFLVYLRDGTQLSYEKLRDKTGAIPVKGYNLFWSEGRVIPLDAVELELRSNAKLPNAVCTGGGTTDVGGSGSTPGSGSTATPPPSTTTPEPADAGVPNDPDADADADVDAGTSQPAPTYPSPTDPELHCSADGQSYSYGGCGKPPVGPEGLCSPVYYAEPCFDSQVQIPPPPVPSTWPCPLAVDAGTAPTPNQGAN